MKNKVIGALLFALFSNAMADESIFVDSKTTNNQQPQTQEIRELIDLKATQESFRRDRKGNENTLQLSFEAGRTFQIRTRYAMTTTIILDGDRVVDAILGDTEGFELVNMKKDKYDLSNIVLVKPRLIGIDTSLTIIGESGNLYSFYLYSTDHTSPLLPHLIVFMSEARGTIGKIPIVNLEEEAIKREAKLKKEEEERKKREEEEANYINIGDATNRLKIKISELERGYEQKGAEALKAIEIFNDNKFTYFRYDRNRADSRFPVVYRVVDGYDNPINTRIVGDFIIAETISDKFTLRIGDEYVCVRRLVSDKK